MFSNECAIGAKRLVLNECDQMKMASSISALLNSPYFTAAGVVAISYLALKFAFSLFKGFRTYILAKIIGDGSNLKRYGEWAGA